MNGDACDDVNETHERKQIERQTTDKFYQFNVNIEQNSYLKTMKATKIK